MGMNQYYNIISFFFNNINHLHLRGYQSSTYCFKVSFQEKEEKSAIRCWESFLLDSTKRKESMKEMRKACVCIHFIWKIKMFFGFFLDFFFMLKDGVDEEFGMNIACSRQKH